MCGARDGLLGVCACLSACIKSAGTKKTVRQTSGRRLEKFKILYWDASLACLGSSLVRNRREEKSHTCKPIANAVGYFGNEGWVTLTRGGWRNTRTIRKKARRGQGEEGEVGGTVSGKREKQKAWRRARFL